MRGVAPALNPIQTKSVPLRAGSFADTMCCEANTSVSVPMCVTEQRNNAIRCAAQQNWQMQK
ncbi:MAG: hypothetical protein II969_07545 [Anaerolineaceae bacterium]|nr:hypothetical protein [Anaerolineaceae bacterium]